MKIKKALLIALPVIICAVLAFGYYQYNKPKPDVATLDATPVSAITLYKEYTINEINANRLYLNKPVQVNGKVLEVKQNKYEPFQIILDTGDPMFGVACTMGNSRKIVRPGDQVTIKGICTGYLNDVVLINSILLN